MRSLTYRISLGYLLTTAVTVAVGAFAAVEFVRLGGSVGRVLEENYRSVLAAENMMEELERQEALLVRAQRGDEAAARGFEGVSPEFVRWYDEARRGAVLPEEPALLDSIGRAYDAFAAAADALLNPDGAAGGAAGGDGSGTTIEAADRLRAHSRRLLDINQSAMLSTRARVERASRRATWTVLGTAGLAALGSLLASVAFAGSVTRPLRRLTESVRRVRRGHLHERVPVTTHDEVGELGHAFNQMTERLAAYEALNVQALTAERDRAEIERHKAASLVEAMPSPVVVTTGEGRVALLNRAAQQLFPAPAETPGWEGQPLDVVAPELARHLRADPSAIGEALLTFPVGQAARTFRLRRTLIHGAEGVALQIALLEDVTPFQELDRARSEFVATVSHELRTPLTSLGVALDLLLAELVGPLGPEQRDLLATAKADQDRLKRLVTDLVALARLEAGEARGSESIDLAAVVASSLDGLRLAAQDAGVRLTSSFDGEPVRVRGSLQPLGWVVTNLVANAIRHAPPGTEVAVRGRIDGGLVRVEVTDEGPGVPAEATERIFEPFVQADGGGRRPGSAGLGLSIAHRAVDAHGGRIWAEPGPGGRFVFTLPLDPQA